MAKGRRTTHRSRTGIKLYAVRDAEGFKEIRTYKAGARARHQPAGRGRAKVEVGLFRVSRCVTCAPGCCIDNPWSFA